MKKLWLLIFLFPFFVSAVYGQESLGFSDPNALPKGAYRLPVEVRGGDTTFLVTLKPVHVYPPMVFKNKKQEKFYWKTVRDVKKTLPYAKLVSAELIETNKHLATLQDDKERKKYLEEYEKQLFKQYEKDLRAMTFSQGKLLLKLIDREVDQTSYELIKYYRGGFSAFFWQGIAKIFGADLKSRYDTSKEEDQIIERVVNLVEAGQL